MSHPELLLDRFPERTVLSLFWASAARHPDRVFIRNLVPAGESLEEVPETYGEFQKRLRSAAAYLQQAGVGPGDRVLLLAENSPEWQLFALATTMLGATPAAVFANLARESIQDICLRVTPRVVVVSSEKQWEKLKGYEPALVLARDELAGVSSAIATASWSEVFSKEPLASASCDALLAKVTGDSPFLLIFTSGTTGRQKGVLVRQGAFATTLDNFRAAAQMSPEDVGLMFLPYAHIAGQAQFHLAHATGHSLLHVSRREDVQPGFLFSPTYTLSVPLIYERIYNQVQQQLAEKPAPVRALLEAAGRAAARVRCDGSKSLSDRLLTALFDRVLGARVKARLGGKIRALFAGGAPTPPHLFRFFESLGIPYVTAYGMSETASMIVSNSALLPRYADSAGFRSPDVLIRIEADGEICVKGPLVFDGYFEPEDNQGAFTDDGYFRTGDLGEFSEGGYLRLLGRKKDLLVLATGKKVAPGPLEERLVQGAPIDAAVVFGDGAQYVAAALFIPPAQLELLGATEEARIASLLPLVKARLAGVSSYEIPKKLLLLPGTPADYPDLLTPSFKLKRAVFQTMFRTEIDRLFAS